MIRVSVDTQSGEPPPLPAEVVTRLVRATLTDHSTHTARMQIVFTSDEHLRQLKQQFFGLDQYTDVLAFRLNEENEQLEGEIYISLERALENSQLYDESYMRELMRLVIHGSLHLMGYTDDAPNEQAKMRELENHYLASAPRVG